MHEAEAIALRNRLIGAGALCVLVFIVSLFIPEPAEQGEDQGVVIELGPRSSVPLESADGGAAGATASEPAVSAPAPPGPTGAAETDASPPAAQASTSAPEPRQPAVAAEAAPPAEPSPAPAPAPSRDATATAKPAAQPAAPAAPGRWWIQAASYSDPEMARAGRKRATARGFDTRLNEVRIDGKAWWRLQIGPFVDAAAAEAALAEVEAAGFRGARAIERQ
ncbi:SPOR domain-containing protein [Algiphilus sp.]|uniref:SPOR domain-containing protein n=1 Tax=Algiphilus sp. TaxID=1872431 RepID=UPI003B52E375